MAELQERLQSDLNNAMRARDELRKSALRMLLAAVTNARIEARAELNDEAVLAVIQKQAKQRRESIVEFTKGNRQDLVDKEAAELGILEEYLPAQVDRAEIEAAALARIAETGATSARDIGKVMPPLVKQFSGRADGRLINEVVRSLLGP